jgi:hypothetical protein
MTNCDGSLTFIRVLYDPEVDGEEALMKVENPKSQDNKSNMNTLSQSYSYFWGHL